MATEQEIKNFMSEAFKDGAKPYIDGIVLTDSEKKLFNEVLKTAKGKEIWDSGTALHQR